MFFLFISKGKSGDWWDMMSFHLIKPNTYFSSRKTLNHKRHYLYINHYYMSINKFLKEGNERLQKKIERNETNIILTYCMFYQYMYFVELHNSNRKLNDSPSTWLSGLVDREPTVLHLLFRLIFTDGSLQSCIYYVPYAMAFM